MEMRRVGVVAATPKGRSAWWVVHHWAGLKFGLLLTFILFTGTLATVSNEIDWLANPAMRAPTRPGPMASWGQWYRAAESMGATVEELHAPIGAGFAVRAKVSDAQGEDRLVHIDPWTAEVQGIGSTGTVQDVLRDLHRTLMLPSDVGIVLVGLFALPLLATLVTAFKIYKKWWRGFTRLPRPMRHRDREMRRYIGDLHRLAGVWSLWFIALIAATGLWYLAEKLGAGAPEHDKPERIVAAPPSAVALDRMVADAHARWPGLRLRGIEIDDARVMLEGQDGTLLVRDRANRLWYDARDGQLLARQPAAALSAHQRIAEAADPLHFGNWGGLASKLVWFVFGLALTALAVTGMLICAWRIGTAGTRFTALMLAMGVIGAVELLLVIWALMGLFLG